MIPHDLKHYRAPDAFSLIADETAGWLIAALLFAGWLADRQGWLA